MVVVAESLLSAFFSVLFDRIASRKLLSFFILNDFDEALLEELKGLLLSVSAVLGDAEEKQVSDPLMKCWVDKLREAVYDADDVLDQIATKALQCDENCPLQTVADKVTACFSSSDSPVSQLERINRRLESILKHRCMLGLKEGGGKISSLSMPTTCLVKEHEVYGRDEDRDFIVKKLLSLNEENEEHVSVIAIVGMAGMGKTTLSQMVYKDPRLESRFKVRLWVYISDGCSVFEVTKKIYDSFTGFDSNIRDLNSLQLKLESKLKGKRFLLVLDDYWAEGFLDWDLLKKPLESGLRGSSIIVTTRNESVVLTMHAAEPYHKIEHLSDGASWQLFVHFAFRNRDPEATPTLKEIGKKIVEKCKGHPLSVKTLGSLLAFKAEAKDWNNVLQSKVWDLPADKSNIMPVLKLSYRHLPGHLKRCFAYCSLFPKGYEGSKRNLINLWMAEGLLLPSKSKETMEEVGEEYFHELSSRSFLQCNNLSFTMHDLMIDLAQHVGGEFFHKFEPSDPQEVQNVRHLSFLMDEINRLEDFESLFDLSQLRTFLSLSNTTQTHPIEGFLTLLLSIPCLKLRVLSLSNWRIYYLPESIGHLEHIRYLNLSDTPLKQLPDSVASLYNLQTLMLSNCCNLTELPTNLQKLTNMHHLDVSGTKLSEMPPQFGRLKHLQLLTTFVVSSNGSKMRELGALSNLHGVLSIVNLHEVVDPGDASEANLKEKKFLDGLELKWEAVAIRNAEREKDVLDYLEPHTNLKSLKIENYGGAMFSDWLGNSFSNMVSVHLVFCRTCFSLPPLGQLPNLKTLDIKNMTSLEVVNPEFYGNHARPFSSLEKLTFENMPIWQGWPQGEEKEFPSLQEFHINNCPKLGDSLPSVPALPEKMNQGNASLTISGCPLLGPLCKRDGFYWHLVSRLQRLVIDEETIIPHDNAEQ